MSARGKTISRNFAVLSAGQMTGKLVAFVVTLRLTRVLETGAFGLVVFATSVLAYASLVVDFGLDSLGAIETARRKVAAQDLVRCVLMLRVVLTAAGFVLLGLFAWIAPISATSRAVLLLYGLTLVADALHLDWVFLGFERMKPVAIGEILFQVTFAAGVFALVHSPADVIRVPLAYFAGRAVSTAFVGRQYLQLFGSIAGSFDRPLAGRLLRDSIPLMGSAAVSMVLNNFDIVLIGLTVSAAAAGLYGAAYRVVWIPTMLSAAYFTALRPSLAKSSVAGLHTVETLLRRSVRMTASLAVASVVVAAMLSRPIVELLYGSSYAAAAVPLEILLCAFGLLVVSRNFRNLLICHGRQRIEFAMMSLAAAVNVILNLVLVPRRGIEGAALASLAAEAFILVFGYVATRVAIGHISLFRALIRPALAGVPLAGVLQVTGTLPLLVRLAAGGAAYAVALFALRIVTVEEMRIIVGGWIPSRAQVASDPILQESGANSPR